MKFAVKNFSRIMMVLLIVLLAVFSSAEAFLVAARSPLRFVLSSLTSSSHISEPPAAIVRFQPNRVASFSKPAQHFSVLALTALESGEATKSVPGIPTTEYYFTVTSLLTHSATDAVVQSMRVEELYSILYTTKDSDKYAIFDVREPNETATRKRLASKKNAT